MITLSLHAQLGYGVTTIAQRLAEMHKVVPLWVCGAAEVARSIEDQFGAQAVSAAKFLKGEPPKCDVIIVHCMSDVQYRILLPVLKETRTIVWLLNRPMP